jgi:hypothetical protein
MLVRLVAETLTQCVPLDESEFLVQPRLAGDGPTLFAGLSKRAVSKC